MGLAVVTFVFWALLTVYVLLWVNPNAVLSSCSVSHAVGSPFPQEIQQQSCTSVDAVGVLLPWTIGFLAVSCWVLLFRYRRRASAS